MVLKAIIIGILYWMGCSENALPWTTANAFFSDPLFGGTVAGIVLGNMKLGVEIGSAVEVMYISNVVIGGAMTAETNSVAWLANSLAILANADAETSVAVAAIVGVLGAALFTTYEAVASVFYAMGDKAIAKGDIKAMKRAYIWWPQVLIFPIRFALGFLTVMFGQKYAAGILAAIPEKILYIMKTLGGILPAVGLSILFAYTLKDIKMSIFFFMGLMAVTKCGFNTVAVAVLGICLAVMHYMYSAPAAAAKEEEDL